MHYLYYTCPSQYLHLQVHTANNAGAYAFLDIPFYRRRKNSLLNLLHEFVGLLCQAEGQDGVG